MAGNDFAPGNTSTPVQGDVNWDQLVLYPADTIADQVTISASIKLPEKWSYATALPHPSPQGGAIHFDPVSLTTLIDSPLMCGSIMREFDITPKGVSQRHLLDLFEKSPEGLNVPPERIAAYRNLVSEAGRHVPLAPLCELPLSGGSAEREQRRTGASRSPAMSRCRNWAW